MANNQSLHNNREEAFDEGGIDLRLLWLFAWTNRAWIIIILILSLAAGYAVNRYATPKYEAMTVVQFKEADAGQSLSLPDFIRPGNLDRLNQEMTVLTSKTYKVEALQALPLEVNYRGKGRIKSSDPYVFGPFTVVVEVLDSAIIGREIAVEVGNPFLMKYEWKGQNLELEVKDKVPVSTPAFNMTLHQSGEDISTDQANFSFTIVDEKKRIALMEEKIKVDAENEYGGKVSITFTDVHPQRAIDVVNTIAEAIVKNGLDRKMQSGTAVIHFIEAQIDSLEEELFLQENILKDFKKNAQLISPTIAEETLMEKFRELDAAKLEVLLEEKGLNWLLEYADNRIEDLEALSGYTGNLAYSDFTPYINTLADLENQKQSFLLSLPETDPKVELINRQIKDIKSNFRDALINARDQLNVRRTYLEEQEAKYNKEFLTLPEKESEYMRLVRLSDIKEKYYLLLKEKQAEYEIGLAGILSDYTIVDAAVKAEQVGPNTLANWVIAFIIGLVICLAIVYFQYINHDEILGVPDIARRTNVPIISVVPYYEELERGTPQVVVSNKATSIISEAFRSLRTSIIQDIDKRNPEKTGRLIAITSTVSGEGKTFVASNLARILALMRKKVLVVDYDLRKPKVNKAFGVGMGKGVANILNGQNTIDECIQHVEHYGLDVLTSGPVPANPAELLSMDEAGTLLKDLTERYDYILVDNAPVGMVSDVLPILDQMDMVLYLTRAYRSKVSFMENLNRVQNDSPDANLKIILNNVGAKASLGSFGYGYGYGYGSDCYLENKPKRKVGLIHKWFFKQ